MDFGTGKDTASSDMTDSLAGTPLYLAPELFDGQNPSTSSDIYGLGVLLYHLLTGNYPVSGRTRQDVQRAHRQGQHRSLRDARPDLPPAFIDVIDRALAPNPKDRYGSAGQFGNALAGVAGIGYVPDPATQSRKWRAWVGVAAGLALLFVGLREFNYFRGSHIASGSASAVTEAPSAVPLSAEATIAASAPYNVAASFFAVRNGQETRLAQGSHIAPGDKLFATVEASQPVFVYVINRDEAGESYLLFPLPGYVPGNPVPLNRMNRLPGLRNGQQHYWEVTSAGGREHFYLYVAPRRLVEFEELISSLPRADIGRTVTNMALSKSAIGLLRGVGGVTAAENPSSAVTGPDLTELKPLSDTKETVTGIWARRMSFENPQK